jgi:hypothetical protein
MPSTCTARRMRAYTSTLYTSRCPTNTTSLCIVSERSSPSRVRYAAPNNGAPLTAPVRSKQTFPLRGKESVLVSGPPRRHFGPFSDCHRQPLVRVEVKLDVNDAPRAEGDLADFALDDEICRLMIRLDEFANGTIERMEVRAGIPRRLVLAYRSSEVAQCDLPISGRN